MADEERLITINLLGRDMQFHTLSPGQSVLVQRMGERARKASEAADGDINKLGEAFTGMMVRILDVVDTLFVSERDRQDVEDAVLARKLDVPDLMAILLGGRRPEAEPDDADPKPAKKRAKKAQPKMANTRRATR